MMVALQQGLWEHKPTGQAMQWFLKVQVASVIPAVLRSIWA